MNYFTLIQTSIKASNLSLSDISKKMKSYGYKTNKAYLSKLQNGKITPASDRMNEALAKVLGIDPIELKVAAYREKIPADVLAKLTDYQNTA